MKEIKDKLALAIAQALIGSEDTDATVAVLAIMDVAMFMARSSGIHVEHMLAAVLLANTDDDVERAVDTVRECFAQYGTNNRRLAS